ncbi:roadblock/LC7 domain-containing protein [candidate division WOR-3 bacterium]|nr:roadblock/LC7 domain-containing protein [candidate division WOR-3 bacterium]MCK4575331.1 roadblock/LC7 domain-containing protein [candidate division WOR-3 bacterium]
MPFESVNIFEQDFWEINENLEMLRKQANAESVLLIDKAGQLITSAGDVSEIDISSFASLSAADFAATSQLALLIGESEFNTLFHQGKKLSLYVSVISQSVILVVIFSQRTTLGLVRLKVNNSVKNLEMIFRRIFEKLGTVKEEKEQEFGEDFFEEADSEIDNLFT